MSLEDVQTLIADAARRPRRDTPLRYGLSAFVIARPTEVEATAAFEQLLALAALDAPRRAAQALRTDPAVVMKQTMANSILLAKCDGPGWPGVDGRFPGP